MIPRRIVTVSVLSLLLFSGGRAVAQSEAESFGRGAASLDARVGALEAKVKELEERLSQLGSATARREASRDAADAPMAVVFLAKSVQEANLRSGEGSDRLSLTFEFTSQMKQSLRSFSGVVVMKDLLGKDLLTVAVADETGIKPHGKVQWTGTVPFRQFDDKHRRLRTLDVKDVAVSFVVEKVVYADGTKAVLSEPSESDSNRVVGQRAPGAGGADVPPPENVNAPPPVAPPPPPAIRESAGQPAGALRGGRGE